MATISMVSSLCGSSNPRKAEADENLPYDDKSKEGSNETLWFPSHDKIETCENEARTQCKTYKCGTKGVM